MGMHGKTKAAFEELRALILAGEVGADGYLPSRNHLAVLLGIGRGAVPSLLTALAQSGLTDCASGHHIRIIVRKEPPVRRKILVLSGRMREDFRGIHDNLETLEARAVFSGITAAAEEFNIDLIPPGSRTLPETPEGLTQWCVREKIDGVILMELETPYIAETLRLFHIPAVVANMESCENIYSSGMDHRSVGRAAGKFLTSLGHRRIAVLLNKNNEWMYKEMLAGIKGVLAEDDIPLRSDFVLKVNNTARELCIARLKDLLLSHGRPTAIFTGRDCLAALVYAAANRAGLRIPEDLSVLGYDNITWPDGRYFGLSTIEQPASQIGRAAVEIMIRSWLAGSNEPESIRLAPGPLIQRESLAPVPKRIVRGGL